MRKMKGVEETDVAFFSDPLAWVSPVTEWLPTGVLGIDKLTGGGYPVGRIIEVAAWEGVGKSTLLDQSIAMTQSTGGIACLIDTEQARDSKYTARLGVRLDELIVQRAETLEEAFTGIDNALAIQEAFAVELAKVGKRPNPMLIVIDSIAGLPTKAERDGEAGDSHVGVAARAIRQNMRRLCQRIANARATLVFSNQFYESIGGYGGLKTYGGGGIRYYTSLRIWLTRKDYLKKGSVQVGHEIEAKLKKTRVSAPKAPAMLGLLWGQGIHNAYTLFDWGKTHGVNADHRWVTQAGAWQYLMKPDGEYDTFQGTYLGFVDVLQANPDIYAQMAQQYILEE